jgi:hypothetical protein
MRITHWLGIAFAGVGITIAFVTLKPWGGREAPRSFDDHMKGIQRADTGALRGFQSTLPGENVESSDIEKTIATFRETLRANFAESAPPGFPCTPRDRDQIIELACDRVRILLTADFSTYVEHVRRLNGLAPDSPELQRRLVDRDKWQMYANSYRHCAIDASRAELIPAYASGQMLRPFAGGMTTFEPKVHPFVDLGHANTELGSAADIIDVRVPVRTTDARTSEPITVFLVIRLARASESAPWLPWQLGVNDPTDKHPLIPPPF